MNMCVHTVTAPDGARSDSGDALVELLGYTKPKGGNLHREKQTSTKKRNLHREKKTSTEKKKTSTEKKKLHKEKKRSQQNAIFSTRLARSKKKYIGFFSYIKQKPFRSSGRFF